MLPLAAPGGALQRRMQLGGLALLVTALHLWMVHQGLPARLGEGDADRAPRRIEVAFVRELVQATPAAVPTPPPRPAPRLARLPTAPARAASAAEPAPVPPTQEPVPVSWTRESKGTRNRGSSISSGLVGTRRNSSRWWWPRSTGWPSAR